VNDDELQRAYGRAIRSPTDRAACPDPGAIADLAARRGNEEARLATLDHAMGCSACRRDLDLLVVADRAAARSSQPPNWIAAAAAAILAVGLGTLSLRAVLHQRPPEVERGGALAVGLVSPRRGTEVPRPVGLTWHAVPGAREYRAEVLAADGTPLWSRTGADSTASVPDSVVAGGGSYGWWVAARLADGSTIRSAVMSFTVR